MKYLCDGLDISASGFYDWRNRPINKRVENDVKLLLDIERVFKESRATYGSPRVQDD